jgi:hypothetical protein
MSISDLTEVTNGRTATLREFPLSGNGHCVQVIEE